MKRKTKVISLLTVCMLLFGSVLAYAGSNSVKARFKDSTAMIVRSEYLDVPNDTELKLAIGNTDAGVEFTANVYKKGLIWDTYIDKYTPSDAEGGSTKIKVSSGEYQIRLVRAYTSVNATATLSK